MKSLPDEKPRPYLIATAATAKQHRSKSTQKVKRQRESQRGREDIVGVSHCAYSDPA